jgi:glutamine cyclotransferase
MLTESCKKSSPDASTPVYGYEVVNTYYHDPSAFTQGLVYVDGRLYESTGQRGQSTLRAVKLSNGSVERMVKLGPKYFGEGMAVVDDRIIQLTWKSNVAFVYKKDTFELIEEIAYPYEGWGLAYDGKRLVASDGSETIRFLNSATLEEVGFLKVHDENGFVSKLNELEFVGGELFANVWSQDRIARIDLDKGRIVGWIDLAGLLPSSDRSRQTDVLNGIAYDEEGDRLFVTGKYWPKLFEIKLAQRN